MTLVFNIMLAILLLQNRAINEIGYSDDTSTQSVKIIMNVLCLLSKRLHVCLILVYRPYRSLRPFRNEELDQLNADCVFA